MNTIKILFISAALMGSVSVAAAQTGTKNFANDGIQTVAQTTSVYNDQNTAVENNASDRFNDPKWVSSHLSADDFHF